MAVIAQRLPAATDLSTRATGDYVRFRCDTEAELPSTNVQNGDAAYTIDTKKMWDRVAGAWVERGDASNTGGGGGPHTHPISDVTDLQAGLDGKAATASGVPAGLIAMWYGLIAAIPSGWVLCDGNNGTPDMRGRYPKGAAAAAEAGDTGGATTHTHAAHAALSHSGAAVDNHASHTHTYTEVVNHTHAVNITDPGHFHTMVEGTTDGSGDFVDRSNSAAASNIVTSTATTGITATTSNPAGGVATGTTAGPSATLTHNVTQPSQHAAQSHDTPNSEPPFRTVLWIMKT